MHFREGDRGAVLAAETSWKLREAEVNELIMLHGAKAGRILQKALEKKVPLHLTLFHAGVWYKYRAVMTDLMENRFDVRITPLKRGRVFEIEAEQSVGVTLQYGFGGGYDKYIFDTPVIGVGKSQDSGFGGVLSLAVPEEIEVVPRRSYVRVRVPSTFDVDVEIWCRGTRVGDGAFAGAEVFQNWHGKLVDLSAGGLQVAVDLSQGPDFAESQFVGLQFSPMPDETPLKFNAYVRNVHPTAKGTSVCVGFEMVGLEASPEGRLVLQRLCGMVDEYHKIDDRNRKI